MSVDQRFPEALRAALHQRARRRPYLFSEGLCHGSQLRSLPSSCYVSHVLEETRWSALERALSEAFADLPGLSDPGLSCIASSTPAHETPYPGGFDFVRRCALAYTTLFSIFVLAPASDPSVYLELGIALGLGVPLLLVHEGQPPLLAELSQQGEGDFRALCQQLRGQVQRGEFAFGPGEFLADLPAAASLAVQYLVFPGGLAEDEDFLAALEGALGQISPQLYRHPTAARSGPRGPDLGHLRQLVQQTRFAAYRVEASCSPLTFLALGISMGLGRPYLMLYEQGTRVARDLRGIGIPSFANFTSLAQEFAAQHRPYLQTVLGKG